MERKSKIILSLIVLVVLVNAIILVFYFSSSNKSITGHAVLSSVDENANNQAITSSQNNSKTPVTITTGSSSSGGSSGRSSGGSSSGGSSEGGSSGGGNVIVEKTSKIYIEPSKISAAKNNEFSISVKIDTNADIYGYQFDLIFNPALINVVNITGGNFLKQDGTNTYVFNTIDNDLGKIRFAESRLGVQTGVSGKGLIATVILKAVSAGSANIELAETAVVDLNGNSVKVTTANANAAIR